LPRFDRNLSHISPTTSRAAADGFLPIARCVNHELWDVTDPQRLCRSQEEAHGHVVAVDSGESPREISAKQFGPIKWRRPNPSPVNVQDALGLVGGRGRTDGAATCGQSCCGESSMTTIKNPNRPFSGGGAATALYDCVFINR
jgi:hypothetical protein